jgi:hypothetical protein
MKIKDYKSRILNIAKGKISESIFFYFCEQNEIPVNTRKCQTPFYIPDKRDFILGREEWDIKNLFLVHKSPILSTDEYLNLPALIPSRGDWDQWSKKDNCIHAPETESVCYLFSFMKGWEDGSPFLNIELSEEQNIFLGNLIVETKKTDIPYTEKWFWSKMAEKGQGNHFKFDLKFHPELILCGIAQEKDFIKFIDLMPQSFQNNIFKTRIKNRGIELKHLSSFVSLYPHLEEKINCGKILN